MSGALAAGLFVAFFALWPLHWHRVEARRPWPVALCGLLALASLFGGLAALCVATGGAP